MCFLNVSRKIGENLFIRYLSNTHHIFQKITIFLQKLRLNKIKPDKTLNRFKKAINN